MENARNSASATRKCLSRENSTSVIRKQGSWCRPDPRIASFARLAYYMVRQGSYIPASCWGARSPLGKISLLDRSRMGADRPRSHDLANGTSVLGLVVGEYPGWRGVRAYALPLVWPGSNSNRQWPILPGKGSSILRFSFHFSPTA